MGIRIPLFSEFGLSYENLDSHNQILDADNRNLDSHMQNLDSDMGICFPICRLMILFVWDSLFPK